MCLLFLEFLLLRFTVYFLFYDFTVLHIYIFILLCV